MAIIIKVCALQFIWIISVFCDNYTNNHFIKMEQNQFKTKEARLITFNTQTEGDIEVDLEFKVPFITFPVKKSIDMATGAVANINLGSIILAGVMIIGLVFILPGALVLLSKKTMPYPMNHPGYRSEDSSPTEWWKILSILDKTLNESQMDTTSCLQRMICWTVKNSSKNVNSGQSSSNDKIIDGLATNKWILNLIDGTSIHKAVQDGLNNQHCSKEYSNCKLTQRSFQLFIKQFITTINGK